MIKRYTLPEMGKIWSQENRYRKWLDVELAVCEVQTERGVIPKEAWEEIRSKADFDSQRIDEIETTVQHDVIAFLTSVAEKVGPASRYIHLGMTSSDMLDTATSLQLKEAGELLLKDLEDLRRVLARRAVEFKHTVCIGRSHGIHAEPTTFGLKLALWYDEAGRNIQRLKEAIEGIRVGMISGAIGTFAHLDPIIEEGVCKKLGLKPAPVSTQVVQRDRHAHYLNVLAVIGASLEKIAVEIRHLQRTEVLEAEEYFSKGQKGSSAMPHKRNPITCERIAGLARLLRSNAVAGLENVALWHERDISHSSVERVILPDSTILLNYILCKTTDLIDQLLVYPGKMKQNLEMTRGLIFSQPLLLALVQKGLSREEAYGLVQDEAMACWKSGEHFQNRVQKNKRIGEILSSDEIEKCFDLDNQLRNVDKIFKRVNL
ncbi:adenylosuccinate lyase [bacterium]|nr:adenylosuccinate lyase [bacterium]RQV96006.1 MAG: adenylosuccinate lyase [bacterium]